MSLNRVRLGGDLFKVHYHLAMRGSNLESKPDKLDKGPSHVGHELIETHIGTRMHGR